VEASVFHRSLQPAGTFWLTVTAARKTYHVRVTSVGPGRRSCVVYFTVQYVQSRAQYIHSDTKTTNVIIAAHPKNFFSVPSFPALLPIGSSSQAV
jgi:hypothetical protein